MFSRLMVYFLLELAWLLHNVLIHPVIGVLGAGRLPLLRDAARKLHDITTPED